MEQSEAHFPESAGIIRDELFDRAQSLAIEGSIEAFDHYLKSAMSGNPVSAYMVSQYYSRGIAKGTGMDTFFWTAYAAAGYYIPAREVMKGFSDVPSDAEFSEYCQERADEGSPAAAFMAGMGHYLGKDDSFDPVLACELFRRSSEGGNLDGACMLALCMIRGAGTAQDLENGVSLLKDTAAKGCIRAALEYARYLERGMFGDKDCNAAFRIYESLASNKIPVGMYETGRCCLDGVGTERDADMGYSWFTMAQSFGSLGGNFGMARCMLGGIVENKRDEGFKLLNDCADAGCIDALIMLAHLYNKGGRVVKKDSKKAFECYLKAADLGCAAAELYVSEAYMEGTEVKRDLKKGHHYAMRSAAHGNIEACYTAGMAMLNGRGAPRDETAGFEFLRMAMAAGYMKATYAVAGCYLKGTGVKKNISKAFEIHKSLADLGFAKSLLYVGECYYLGENVPQDYAEAIRLFTEGSKYDNAICEYYLGECYSKGKGVQPDEVTALKWYKKAADHGHIISRDIVNDSKNRALLEDATPFATFEKSARSGNAQSMYIVGRYYEDGIGIERDLNKAKEWYQKAKKRGNSAAKRALEALEAQQSGS